MFPLAVFVPTESVLEKDKLSFSYASLNIKGDSDLMEGDGPFNSMIGSIFKALQEGASATESASSFDEFF